MGDLWKSYDTMVGRLLERFSGPFGLSLASPSPRVRMFTNLGPEEI